MLLYVLSVIVLVLIFLHIYLNYNYKARLLRKVPGPDYVFLVGNALDFLSTPVKVFGLLRKYNSQWDRLHRFWSMSFGAVNIHTPEDVEVILSTTKYNEKSILYTFLRPWLQDGLLVSSGQKWHQRRKILTPAFHFNILQRFCVVMEENCRKMVEVLAKSTGGKINVVPVMSEFTLNSICETAMGTQFSEEIADDGLIYKNAIGQLAKTLVKRTTRIPLYSDFLFNLSSIGREQRKHIKIVHNFTRKVIKERREYMESNANEFIGDHDQNELYMSNKRKRPAMLDLLLLAEKDNLIDEIGIQEEVDTFMFEGHDTTAAGLIFSLMLLAGHPEIQDKIYEELTEIFGDSDRSVSYDDLNKMKYLECCIKESLRLYPPVPFISRQLNEPITLGGYDLPANIFCHIHIYDLHRRSDLYPNPFLFDPDRFLPENCAGRHPFAYIPFSAGPRNCIGTRFAMMEMKCALASIFRRFRLEAVTRPLDLHIAQDLVLRNDGPVYVTFIERND